LAHYIIVVCSECGSYLLAKNGQKSRTCPYCGSRILLEKAKKVASARDAGEASAILRRFKEKASAKHGKARFRRLF
jgi:DNA-directed RNA polymerase subunit RPC12/RpoP